MSNLKKIGILLIVVSIICAGFGYHQTHNEDYEQVSREYEAYSYIDRELGSLYSPDSFAGMINRGIASKFEKAANAWAPKVRSYKDRAKGFYIAGGVLLVSGIAAVLRSKKKETVDNTEENMQ